MVHVFWVYHGVSIWTSLFTRSWTLENNTFGTPTIHGRDRYRNSIRGAQWKLAIFAKFPAVVCCCVFQLEKEGRKISIPNSSIHIILFRLLKHQIIQNPAKMHDRNGSCRNQSLCSDATVALRSEQAFHLCNYVKCPNFLCSLFGACSLFALHSPPRSGPVVIIVAANGSTPRDVSMWAMRKLVV